MESERVKLKKGYKPKKSDPAEVGELEGGPDRGIS